jgi:integrase/recombinase XerD
MNISFTPELNNRADSEGLHLIQIRCTQNWKHKRVSTGVSINPKYWDSKKHRIKGNHEMQEDYNKIVAQKIKCLTTAYTSLIEQEEEVSLDDLIRHFSENKSVSFFDFAINVKLEGIKARKKMGTYRRYETAINKFKTFIGGHININKVSYELIKRYELHLLAKLGNSQDTISANLSVLRAVINETIRHGVYTCRNPFEQVHLKYTDNTKEKLTLEELRRFSTASLPNIPSLHLARDFFMACFLAEGCRGGDMVVMSKDNVSVEGILAYNQLKTGKSMATKISSSLSTLINKYAGDSPYLFPLRKEGEKPTERIINSRLTFINKYLKEVCKYAGILKKITTHCARHTFTDLALMATDDNIYKVQKLLGHTSVKTTEIYARNRVSYNQEESVIDRIWEKNVEE